MATGILPRTSLAESCGLAVDNGITVDRSLRTTDPRIYAIGDCASFPLGRDGRRVRLESVQNAVEQARHVARQIVDGSGPFAAVPWFWTKQYDLALQIAGIADGCDETVVESPDGSRGYAVSGYAAGRLRYVESDNHAARHVAARRELAADGWYTSMLDLHRCPSIF
jgi:3-phenylpropionate/trans-cinnamate dioxygenase ferredoxin reductase subunit